MAIYPGATFRPTAFGGKTARNKQGRGILHVAVNRAQTLAPWNDNTWHFYIGLAAPDGSTDGSGGPAVCTQYVDTEYRAYGDVDANDDAIVVETAGGTGTSPQLNAEKWTRAQELRIIDLMRWEANQSGGAPIALLPDSRAGRRGWGPHRLGVKHSAGPRPGWWNPGGEVWSNALGKECPGDAKVLQVPGIINEAASGHQEDDMPLNAADGDFIYMKIQQAVLDLRDSNHRNLLDLGNQLRADIYGAVGGLAKTAGAAPAVDPKSLAEALRPIIADAVAAGMAADSGAKADEIVDRLVVRLAD